MDPAEVHGLLRASGLEIIARFGGFDGRPLPDDGIAGPVVDQNIYVARPRRR
jgi:hypothetical protein